MQNAPENKKMKSIRDGIGEEINIIYIAGKVSGLHYADVVAKFAKRAEELRALGYEVVNPCELVDESCTWEEALKICLAHLVYCNYIDMLPDWQSSKGATFERECALKMGIMVFQEVPSSNPVADMIKTEF